jgi:hypothetical protein
MQAWRDAGADEPRVRREPLEPVREDGVQALVLARLHHERQLRQPRPERLAFSVTLRAFIATVPSRADRQLSLAARQSHVAQTVAYWGRPTGR